MTSEGWGKSINVAEDRVQFVDDKMKKSGVILPLLVVAIVDQGQNYHQTSS